MLTPWAWPSLQGTGISHGRHSAPMEGGTEDGKGHHWGDLPGDGRQTWHGCRSQEAWMMHSCGRRLALRSRMVSDIRGVADRCTSPLLLERSCCHGFGSSDPWGVFTRGGVKSSCRNMRQLGPLNLSRFVEGRYGQITRQILPSWLCSQWLDLTPPARSAPPARRHSVDERSAGIEGSPGTLAGCICSCHETPVGRA
jgi:hypothetical protein